VIKLASATRSAAAKRIGFLLSTLLMVGAEISTAWFRLFIGVSLSSESQVGSRISFGSVRADHSIDLPSSILVALCNHS
jgi:hypothetical protein